MLPPPFPLNLPMWHELLPQISMSNLEILLARRKNGLQVVLFFLNLQQTTTKSTFLSQTSPLFFFLFSCSIFSLDVEPSEMPRITPPHTFSHHLSRVSPPKIFKTFIYTPIWNAFYQLAPLASTPPHFSSPSALESPTIILGTLAYSTPPSVMRWVTAPHKSTIAYLSRIHKKKSTKNAKDRAIRK